MQTNNKDAKTESTRHLFEAIEHVRRDIDAVEFWAGAVSEFTQPIPDYDKIQHKAWPVHHAAASR